MLKKMIIAWLLGLLLVAPAANAFHLKINLGPQARIGFFAIDPEEPMFIGVTPLELRGPAFDFMERATRPWPHIPIIEVPFANPLMIFRIFWAPWVEKGTNEHMHQNAGHFDGPVTQADGPVSEGDASAESK